MENIEQLKQENEKLQERLNNAAKFFREQKAQIEALTKENDELKHDADSFNSLQENYENTIKSKDQAYKVLQETYNEVFAENKQLKDQVESYGFNSESDANNLKDLNNQLNEYELKLQASEKTYEELKELYDRDLKRYNELEDNYERLQNRYQDIKNELDKKLIEVAKLNSDNDILRESDKKFKEAYAQLQNKLQNVEDLNNKQTEQIKQLITQLANADNSNNELFERVEQLTQMYDDEKNKSLGIENDYNELNNKFTIFSNSYEKLTNDILELITERKNLIQNKNSENNQQKNLETNQPKNIKIPKNINKNSTGSQFMEDAVGMNI